MNRRNALLMLGAIPFAARVASAASPQIVIHKTPTCGCCGVWVAHMGKAGFTAQVHDMDDLTPVKTRLKVPARLASCHTGEIGGYFVEGHVPAADVQRLLREKPAALGLTVPGMPAGSPGMEVPSGRVDAYDVLLVAKDGSTSVFSSYGKQDAITTIAGRSALRD